MPDPEHSPVGRPDHSGEEIPIVNEERTPAGAREPLPAEAETAAVDQGDEVQVYPESHDASPPVAVIPAEQPHAGGGGGKPPESGGGGGGDGGDEDEDEEQMAKMSFLEHLEELRKRLIHSLIAVALAFFVCFSFAQKIFDYMSVPVRSALREMKLPEQLYFNHPTDAFTMYLDLALVTALFVASPIVLYEVWAFISPGLYKNEKKYAVPFVFFCSSLFISGGLFGYFIAFPYALKFLLNFGGEHVKPWITVNEYMSMFWTVMLGLGLVFELPVLMLFLGLLRIVTPRFLLNNFRYAVLLIFIVAAVVTPTPDVMNMMIFAIPMIGLYLLGVGLVWLVRRNKGPRTA